MGSMSSGEISRVSAEMLNILRIAVQRIRSWIEGRYTVLELRSACRTGL